MILTLEIILEDFIRFYIIRFYNRMLSQQTINIKCFWGGGYFQVLQTY